MKKRVSLLSKTKTELIFTMNRVNLYLVTFLQIEQGASGVTMKKINLEAHFY